jgi:hypothetical protein
MTTDGRDGFLDALRGSHSERVLRGLPALERPEGSWGRGLRMKPARNDLPSSRP